MSDKKSVADAGTVLTAWSRLFVGALVRAGVTEAVISPGSRSTPVTWALLHESRIRCTRALDERSAGFFALGIGRESGRPAVLVCTSGTAGAHYYPAVIEAAQSAVPLLVVTCDRPVELSDCGAAQTMVQTELFGRFARGFFELGDPRVELGALRSVSRKASQAIALTRGPIPGPVQINFPAKKPLEPAPMDSMEAKELDTLVDQLLDRAPHVHFPTSVASPEALSHFAQKLNASSRPLVILGAADRETARLVVRLAEEIQAPLCAETSAHAPSAFPLQPMCSLATSLPKPDLILRFGATPTAASLADFLGTLDCPQLLVTSHGYADPTQTATDVLMSELRPAALGLLELSCTTTADAEYLSAWENAAAALRLRLCKALVAPPDNTSTPLLEPHAVAAVLSVLGESTQFSIGNSLPLRLVDAVSPHVFSNGNFPRVFVQRGVNGIDGLIAGGAGVALKADRPTLALLGDVTAAHDLSSLALARQVRVPYCIVVLDNAGGHIFDSLPMAAQAKTLGENWQFWSTPPCVDFEAAAHAYGVRFARPSDLTEIGPRVTEALRTPGPTLLQLVTSSSDTFRWLSALQQLPS